MNAASWRPVTYATAAVFAAYRLPELTRYSLWFDELFAITLAQMDWGEMFGAIVRDRTNPPLFYILLKLWMAVGGSSAAWVRLLPCLLGIGAALPLCWLARRFLSPWGATAALAAAAASPLAVFLSNEVRGYSLLLFLSAASLHASLRVIDTLGGEPQIARQSDAPRGLVDVARKRRRRIAILALVNTMLVYTHYFGWLLIAAQMASALVWRRGALRGLGAANAVALSAFVPWATAVVRNSAGDPTPLANVDWISTPGLLDVPRFYDALVARVLTPDVAGLGAVIMLAAVVALAITLGGRGIDSPGRRQLRELSLLATLPVILAFAASVLSTHSVFVPRYLMVAAPAWWLLVGAAITSLGGVTAKPTDPPLEIEFRIRATVLTFALFTLGAGALREVRGGEKIQWADLVASIAADAGPTGGTIHALEGFTSLPTAYYAAIGKARLTVKPVTELGAIVPPAWLIVRSTPGDSSALGAGLAARGVRLTRIHSAGVPSHTITAYRLTTVD